MTGIFVGAEDADAAGDDGLGFVLGRDLPWPGEIPNNMETVKNIMVTLLIQFINKYLIDKDDMVSVYTCAYQTFFVFYVMPH